MARSPRLSAPLPTATAVVVAVLVAMAAILADAGVTTVASEATAAGRMPSSLVLPSRALASVLTSVAERLEEDWSASRRPHSPRTTDLSGSGWRWTRINGLHGADAIVVASFAGLTNGLPGGPWRRSLSVDVIAASDARRETHRRVLNLPPPQIA